MDISLGDGLAAQGLAVDLTPQADLYRIPDALARSVRGFGGPDTLFGGPAADRLSGNEGDDWLLGLAGADSLFGGLGDDRLFGNQGNDLLFGDGGSDLLRGGQGNDSLVGGVGDDTLSGDFGVDTLTGGDGQDVFVLRPETESMDLGFADVITDFGPGDRLGLTGNITEADLQLDRVSNNTIIRRQASGAILAIVSGATPTDLKGQFTRADYAIDGLASARNLTSDLSQAFSGVLGSTNPAELFKLPIDRPSRLQVQAVGQTAPIAIEQIQDLNGNNLIDDGPSTSEVQDRQTSQPLQAAGFDRTLSPGAYFIRLRPLQTDTTYSLNLILAPLTA